GNNERVAFLAYFWWLRHRPPDRRALNLDLLAGKKLVHQLFPLAADGRYLHTAGHDLTLSNREFFRKERNHYLAVIRLTHFVFLHRCSISHLLFVLSVPERLGALAIPDAVEACALATPANKLAGFSPGSFFFHASPRDNPQIPGVAGGGKS